MSHEPAQPGPGVGEAIGGRRGHDRLQQLEDQLWIDLGVRGERPDLPGQADRCRSVPGEHCGGELAERRRDAAGRGGDRAEVQHAEPTAGEQQEVAGV